MSKFKCGLCGTEFNDVDEYINHVTKCATKKRDEDNKQKEDELKKLQKVNEYLVEIKKYEKLLNDCKNQFKITFPTEYELNFPKTTAKTNDKIVKESKLDVDKDKRVYGYVNNKACYTREEFIDKINKDVFNSQDWEILW